MKWKVGFRAATLREFCTLKRVVPWSAKAVKVKSCSPRGGVRKVYAREKPPRAHPTR
jgi:hypothetical protein